MLSTFFRFETRLWLRSTMLYVFLLIVALMIFGATSSDQVTVGASLENTHRNAPFVIERFYAFMGLLTLLMTTAFVNSAATRDFSSNTDQLIFSRPIGKWSYLMGRFWGATLIAVIPMSGVTLGILAGKYMPWTDAERWGPVRWDAHLSGLLTLAVPDTIFAAAVIFAVAILTRSTITSFVAALLMLVAYGVAGVLSRDIERETLAALLDPFGIRTYMHLTKYWTVAERNGLILGAGGLMLWNRLLWLLVSAAILVGACARFRFTTGEGWRFRKAPVAQENGSSPAAQRLAPLAAAVPAVTLRFGPATVLVQLLGRMKLEFLSTVRTTTYIVVVVAALLNCLPNVIFNSREGYGLSSLPVTYIMVDIIRGTLYLFLIALVTYFAGVLVWKERDARTDDIIDASPYPNWIAYVAKFVALGGAILIIQAVVMGVAIGVQAYYHYTRFQLSLYLREMFLLDLIPFAFFMVLAFFVHVLAPNKYVGYFAFIGLLIADTFMWRPLGVVTRMVQFANLPDYTYSDFYGHAPYVPALVWFGIYWALFCALLAGATVLLWPRGRESRTSAAGFRTARGTFMGHYLRPMALVAIAFAAVGGWVFYNTKILNTLRSEDEQRKLAADYEKAYKKYQGLAQPRIQSVKYWIDIYPEQRNVTLRGEQMVKNTGSQPIADVHISLDRDLDNDIAIERATLQADDKRLAYRIYRLNPPLAPGESILMKYTLRTRARGFENDVSQPEVVQNGTFFNNSIVPQMGYQPDRELSNRNDRKKQGLGERDRMPPLERNCTAHCANTYLSNNSDWVDVETVISTSADQYAVAPGSLLREWRENGRRYFHYKLDHLSLNFYSFISARYTIDRAQWNGVSTEVYYDSQHPWNVPRMQNSIRRTLEYATRNFGPYGHRQARIIEFPRVARFAQAFPGTMPYSEAIGFIADIEHPDDIDMVFYVTAHEMGHQWWAHQLTGANMRGATLLSETLAQYTALMVMEKEYGRDQMRKFLKHEMDNYLRGRGGELMKEQPLLTVEANQGYIHYRKGSVAMYYLKEMIGEEAVNRALRRVLERYRYAPAPYPTSWALVDELRAETPPQLQYLIKDLFEDITLFSNRTLDARAVKRADGKYDVTIEVEAKKLKADATGNEKEVPVDDWVDIGAFAKAPKDHQWGATLYRERVHMNKARGTFTFTTAELPEKAGIDPFLLLIDRIPDDNMRKPVVREKAQ
jgi:ABC-2 type transport system permease protein